MIRLASRLTAGGGRESVIRLVLTGAGLALAVSMLLCAAVVFPALHAHDVRRAWTQTSEQNQRPAQDETTTDPLLWRLVEGRFDGRDLLRVDVAARGPDAPVPPGLQRLPGPGEIAASPALRELLHTTDPAQLADRLPGRVTATVGRQALASPDDLVAFVGRAPDQLRAEGGGEMGVLTVRSIEAAPISRSLTRIMRVVLVIGGVGLLLPVVVFVVTATRLAAARREQRLAALRLAGATHGQVGVVAAVEAAIAALAGTALGFGLFLALRPSLARIPFDGATFYPSDLRLSPGWAALVGLGVPALAMAAAIVSLRRIRISPLGVARRAAPVPPRPWPLLMVAIGLALLLAVVMGASNSETSDSLVATGVGVAFVLMITGIVLSGPWLTAVVAWGIARFGRRAPSLLAARRLQDNPSAGFRAISGVTLAVFIGTAFSGLASSFLATEQARSSGLAPGVVASVPTPRFPPPPSPADVERVNAGRLSVDDLPTWPRRMDAAEVAPLVDRVAAIPGVERVVTLHALPHDDGILHSLVRAGAHIGSPVLLTCPDAAQLGLRTCRAPGPAGPGRPATADDGSGTAVVNVIGEHIDPIEVTAPVPAGELDDLPVVSVAAVTDGRVATIERVRTQLERGIPGTPAVTGSDIDAETQSEFRTMQRVSDIGLSVVLVVAGCSLAVAVAGAIVERKQPFALLRLAGTRLSDLRRMVLAEAAAPLLMVAVACVALGLAVAALAIEAAGGRDQSFVMPGASYWLSLVAGLAVALLVVLATLPLLDRLTALDSARFE